MDHLLRPRSALLSEGWDHRTVTTALAKGDLIRVVPGTYAVPQPDATAEQRHARLVHALAPRLHPEAVVSHLSAAVLHGLPVSSNLLGGVQVTRPLGSRARASAHVSTHSASVPDADVDVLDGVRVTSLTRTVVDLACRAPFEWGVVAADAALARGVLPSELTEVARGRGRVQGIGRARAVIAFADAKAGSPAESVSRVALHRAGIRTPTLQFEVVHDGWVATTDFGWKQERVVGEVDGKAKYGALLKPGQSPEDAIMAEKRREEEIRQAGYWVCRWTWADAWKPERLRELLTGAFAAARASD